MAPTDILIFSSSPDSHIPQKLMGVHRMSTEIRKSGFSCQIVHFFQFFNDNELQLLLKKFVGGNTLAVGFSTTFWDDGIADVVTLRNKTTQVVNYLIEHFPNCKIIGGGSSSTVLTSYNLKRVDAIFEGFSEEPFIKYVKSLKANTDDNDHSYLIGSTKIYSQQEQSTIFNFPTSRITYSPEDYVIPNETTTLETARGCIFKCKFCAFPLNGKSKFDFIKDSQTLRDELISNYEQYNLQNYIISDDTFNDSMYKLEKLHQVFTNLPFKIRFVSYLRLDLLGAHREQIDMLKEMGLTGAFFGVETFHHKAAQTIGKGLDPNKSKALLHELKTVHWKNDVKIAVSLIAGLPYETHESYQETKNWILDENNLVELVRIAPLSIPNPMRLNKFNMNTSIFQKNAADYGFYWTDKNSSAWKNISSPVKTRMEAKLIADELTAACKLASRQVQGGFNIFQGWRIAQHIGNVSFEDLINMDRFEYTAWWNSNIIKKNTNAYIHAYKKNLLES